MKKIVLTEVAEKPGYFVGAVTDGKHEADSFFNREGWVGAIRGIIVGSIHWYMFKYAIVLALLISTGIGYKYIDEISSHFASDGWFKGWNILERETGMKNSLTNAHPFYRSKTVRALESQGNFNFKKTFWFVEHGEKELFLMRHVAMGKEGKPLKLERSTYVGDDAEGFCDKYGGTVASKGLVDSSTMRFNLIRSYSDEKYSDSDDWADYAIFRCVVDYADFAGAG